MSAHAGGGGHLKVKTAVHSNVFFKTETGLLSLKPRNNSYPWLLGHDLEGLWGAAFFLVPSTGGVESRNGVCLQRGLLEKWAAKGEVWTEPILSLGLTPDWWYKVLKVVSLHVCMRNNCGFPFSFVGKRLWNSMVKRQSCFLNILWTFASVLCWLRVNETWKNSQYGFTLGPFWE